MPDDYPFRFRCRRSGNCCSIPGGFVQVSDADVTRIAAHLRMSEAGVRSRYLTAAGRLVDGADTRCIFLKSSGATTGGVQTACRIYSARPEKCRTWPFWDELRRSRAAMQKARAICPGITPADEAGCS